MSELNNNLRVYEQVRSVPTDAQKPFNNGRFSGTDINPMWRIKKLTEMFGVCGFGWYYEITSQRLETAVNGDVLCFVDINLYVKVGDEWSKPIVGIGGNKMTTKSFVSDECFKMSLTDALSVACKALGVGADVYFAKDKTKYTMNEPDNRMIDEQQIKMLLELDTNLNKLAEYYKKDVITELTYKQAEKAIKLKQIENAASAWKSPENVVPISDRQLEQE